MIFDEKQKEAVALCCDVSKRIVAVTGPAGAGKTTIIETVARSLIEAGYIVARTGPTGKAAKRIKEATGYDAMTNHRYLEYSHPGEKDPKTGKAYGVSTPKRDYKNPVEADIILADEYMMVNTEMHRNLIDAMKRGACIRMFGDVNQLRPIEGDNYKVTQAPFEQMLEKAPSVKLETIHRQGAGSGIVENGLRIIRGMIPVRKDDFKLHITDNPVDKLRQIIQEYREAGIDFSTTEHQVIVPMNVRWTGALALNGMLQQLYMDTSQPMLELPRHSWAKKNGDVPNVCRVQKGSKVVITSNNYDLDVMNGETGIVLEVTEFGEIAVDLGDREVVIPPVQSYLDGNGNGREFDPRKDVDLAYALTTHKMQGSECKHVVYVLNKSSTYMHSRRNTYTGTSRARLHVDFITDQRSLQTCVLKGKE